MIKDPVCGMVIREEDAAGNITYQGEKYFFCAPGCKVSFIKDPKKYIEQNSSGQSEEGRIVNSKHNRKEE